MQAWESIQRVVDVIETKDLSIGELATVASLSPFYFQRLFNRLVGMPVGEYVRLRRLARSCEALTNTQKRILDIALEFGFSDHANYTRAFRDAYGLTPDEYRQHPVHLNHCLKADVSILYADIEEGVPLITDDMVVEVTRRKLEAPRFFSGIERLLPDTDLSGGRETGVSAAASLWDTFHQTQPVDTVSIGVLYTKRKGDALATYFVGAEGVDQEGLAHFTLLKGDYAVCSIEAESFDLLIGSAIHKAMTYMRRWMKQHKVKCGTFSAELYHSTNSMELWLPIRTEDVGMSFNAIAKQVQNPLFDSLCSYLEETYQVKPVVEFSKCTMQYGWNVKYKKGGRSLCTLYPQEGSFLALIVIGYREMAEAEILLSFLTEYVQQVFADAKTGLQQKWLMIEVGSPEVLEDVKQLVALRRPIKRVRVR
ncbi:DUF3788 family protein [Sphaerochaeta pleomorpha]|nr:DUF3788 family protein [Sphaerochaeta pleomorpha]